MRVFASFLLIGTSVFGFWHWRARNSVAALTCALLFVIASAFSVHSVRGYIALNVTKSRAPMERNKDVYASLKLELAQAQNHLAVLQAALIKSKDWKHARLLRDVAGQSRKIQLSRNTLAEAEIGSHVTPRVGTGLVPRYHPVVFQRHLLDGVVRHQDRPGRCLEPLRAR